MKCASAKSARDYPHDAAFSASKPPVRAPLSARPTLMESRWSTDTPSGMIRDLRTILDGWDFEPGKISVRKIIGRDGREKIQTRIDLGVLQLECAGRPDGTRPHGCDSLLDYYEQRLREHVEVCGDDEDFVLSPEDCRELRHEGYLHYQRYLSLFVLEEYDGVERDTARNLRIIELCERYGASERDRTMLRPQKAYVMMMHTRARVHQAMGRADHDRALKLVDAGISELRRQVREGDEDPFAREAETLWRLREEVMAELPEGSPARLKSELERAVADEDYERAAEIRNRMTG
jgi:hypothetical protein